MWIFVVESKTGCITSNKTAFILQKTIEHLVQTQEGVSEEFLNPPPPQKSGINAKRQVEKL